jgi:hypothetical protein
MDAEALIQALCDAGFDELDRAVVDQFLACGAECVPPLLELARSGEGGPETARALTLLGEIGDTSLLNELSTYFIFEEEDEDAISESAEWAFQRLVARHPAEALAEIRRLAATADPFLLGDLARHLSIAGDLPGRAETLLSFAARLDAPDFDAGDRAMVVTAMLATAFVIGGVHGELAASIRQQYGQHLTPESAQVVREAERAFLEEPFVHEELPDIYQVCCEPFQEEDVEPYVRPEPKIGRNDPCWCGSGKKYKKCHLAADEAG